MNTSTTNRMAIPVAALVGLVTLASCSNRGQGDPVAGERLHEVCLSCHGTALYVSSSRKIESLPALYKEVVRWGDYYNPALSEQEINDVTAYLNTTFYKFQE
jgi:mono/diheme cytochrome c family protein